MTVVLFPEPIAAVVAPAAAGRPPVAGVPVALAFGHGHEWIQDAGLIGLFHCADPTCEVHAVCPGCLGRPEFALVAPAAGFVVYWCVLHCDARLPKRNRRAAR